MHQLNITFLLLFLSLTVFGSPFYSLKGASEKSVIFKRLRDGKIIYQENPKLPLSPASVTKLFTSAAILAEFSPAHKFSTRLFYTGEMKNGIIGGDLVIVGDGDPLLVSEKLWQMAADFRHMGIKKIKGNILIDNSIFDQFHFDSSRSYSETISSNAYDAPISAFGVNFNTFPIAFAPGYQKDDPAFMSVDPYPIEGIHIKNKVVTKSSRRGKDYLQVTRTMQNKITQIEASGRISSTSTIKKLYRSISDPVLHNGQQIRSFLEAAGITVKGSVSASLLPPDAKFLYTIESYEVSRMIKGLNKYSNNYIADVLIKRLGAEYPTAKDDVHSGSMENGMKVLRKFLSEKLGTDSKLQLYNGSGLDPRNRASAEHVIKLLEYAYGHMEIFPEFLASLPASGWDGTLEDRFKKTGMQDIQGTIRGKTGTLTSPISVSSMAGYLGHPKHGLVAFAILENGVPDKRQPSIISLRNRQESALKNILEKF